MASLTSVRRLFLTLEQRRSTLTEGEFVGAWTELSMVLAAVTGATTTAGPAFEAVRRAAAGETPLRVAVTPGTRARDVAAAQLLALGYSAREISDVLSRRITQHALDTAKRIIAVGGDARAAADYLDGQYARARVRIAPPAVESGRARGRRTGFDALIDRYAAVYRVERAVVSAIVAAESGFNPSARSSAGALGLMQLMPPTARELGVDPLDPEQNVEGGVRYFSQLLKKFGRLDLALVAYNAGPGFAERYVRGQTGLYGETREYVRRVLSRLAGGRQEPVPALAKPDTLRAHP